MQTDLCLSLQIKFKDHVPLREIEIESEAKAPDVSLSNFVAVTLFSDDLPNVPDEHFINQLKAHGLYDQFLAKTPESEPDIQITGRISLTPVSEVNLVQTNDFEDVLNGLPNCSQPFDLKQEQQRDEVNREVFLW